MNENDALRMVTEERRVRVPDGTGKVLYEGTAFAYQPNPMMCLVLDDGTHQWVNAGAVQQYTGPRVWPAWGPEPPVGTRGTNSNSARPIVWTRRHDGWHCDQTGCSDCPCDWVEVVGHRAPFVEVVTP